MGYVDSDVHLQNPCGAQGASVPVLTRIQYFRVTSSAHQTSYGPWSQDSVFDNRPRYAGLPKAGVRSRGLEHTRVW